MNFRFSDASDASDALLAGYGWDEQWAEALAAHPAAAPGRVARVDRSACVVLTPEGELTARFEHQLPCTGDWVALRDGAVHAVLPRRSQVVRASADKSSDGQVLAANVDCVLVVVSLAVEPDLGRVERFLALAWESGARPVVVLTKSDLVGDAEQVREDVAAAAPGAEVLVVSSATGAGLDVLSAILGGGTAVLLGQSGAGKSTLVNALLGVEVQAVQEARADGKGRHTTTARELLPLPGPAGGVLIDTPGLRGVGLHESGEGLQQVFAEVEELAARCRFADCEHLTEPGCAVLEAVENGELAQRRLDSYRKLLRENERVAARTDARLRAERLRRFKQRGRAGREAMEAKRNGYAR